MPLQRMPNQPSIKHRLADIVAPGSADSGGPDLLQDPDLMPAELYPSGAGDPTPAAISSSTDAAQGRLSLEIHTGTVLNQGGTYGGFVRPIPVTKMGAGRTYSLSYLAKSLSSSWFLLHLSNQSGAGDENSLSHAVRLTARWLRYTHTAQISGTGQDVPKPDLYGWSMALDGSPSPDRVFLLDNMTLRDVTGTDTPLGTFMEPWPVQPPIEAFACKLWTAEGVRYRLQADAEAVRRRAAEAALPPEVLREINAQLDGALARVSTLPELWPDPEAFRAILPLNDIHAQIFQAQARLWRALGAQTVTVWPANPWEAMSPTDPPRFGVPTAIEVSLMRGNEYRSAAFNISNADDAPLSLHLRLSGLAIGAEVTIYEVGWTDTVSLVPVAAALPEAKREGEDALIYVPPGLTRQVWLRFRGGQLPAGTHLGQVLLSAAGVCTGMPIALRVAPLTFPDQPTLALGGWDYTDVFDYGDITPQNRDQVVAYLRQHRVVPWASSLTLPLGGFDAGAEHMTRPKTETFDEWIGRWPSAPRYHVFINLPLDPSDPQFAKKVALWANFWAGHIREKALRAEQFFLLVADEPSEEVMDKKILAWAEALHASGAGLRVWEDPIHGRLTPSGRQMMASCDVLCPQLAVFLLGPADYRAWFAQARERGTELQFYSANMHSRSADPYVYFRLQAWASWKYEATAEHFWAFSDSGGSSSWNEYCCVEYPWGAGAYVPYFLDRTSVTAGKHMEAIREGVEDYEYLEMLRKAIARRDQRGARGEHVDHARKLLAEAADLVLSVFPAGDQLTTTSLYAIWNWQTPKDRSEADRVREEILAVLPMLDKEDHMTMKLIQFVDTPYSVTYSGSGEAYVSWPGGSNALSADGYSRVSVEVRGTAKTSSFDLIMGKISGSTLADRVASPAADGKIHTYEVIGPEIALLLKGTPNATDRVQLWVYLHQ
jgi:hypothetical protein